jgi:PAS domain S-box-containing protein
MNHWRLDWAARTFPWLATVLVVAMGLLFALSWWTGCQMAAKADAERRDHLLRQAVIVADTINPEWVKKLEFSPADVGTPAYERIREQVRQAAAKIPRCKWVYLVTRHGSRIVFGPDNVATTDPEYTPPGDDYLKPPAELKQAFRQGLPVVGGPYADERGCVISAFVPIMEPASGDVLAMVVVDILAKDWNADINGERWLPLLATLALSLLILVGFLITHRRGQRRKTDTVRLRTQIVGPVALAMLGGLAISGVYEYREYAENSRQVISRITDQTYSEWNRNLRLQVKLLKSHIDDISANPGLMQAWQKRDLPGLTALAALISEPLKQESGISHFYFIAPDKTCFLRMHDPGRRGDPIDHFTLQTAQMTDADAWGLELGPLGTFTLRYVRPWRLNGQTVGYLELGMEFHQLAEQLVKDAGLESLSIVQKQYTTREKFEAGRQAFGFVGKWDDYPGFVVAHQTLATMPGEVVAWVEARHPSSTSNEVFAARLDGKRFYCGIVHLADAAGRDVADLVLLKNVTAEINVATASMLLSLGFAMVLFGGVLAMLWSVTGTVERQLGAAFAKLEEGEEKYRTLVGNLPVGVVVHGADAAIQFANPMAASLLGLKENQLQGKSVLDPAWCFLRNDGSPAPLAEYPVNRVLATGQPIVGQVFGICRPDRASPTWGLCNGYPVRDAQGRIRQVVVTFIDITERLQADEKTKQAHERFLQLAEQSRTIVWETDAEGRYTYVSDVAAALIGHAPEELVGKRHFYDLHPADGRDIFKQVALEVFARHEPFANQENPIVAKDGRQVWVSTNGMPIFDAAGKLTGYRGSDTDITERKQAEGKTQRANKRFNQLAEQSRTIAWEVDAAGLYTYVSPVVKAVAGYAPEELVGKKYFYDQRSKESADFKNSILEIFNTQARFSNLENTILTKDGRMLWFSTNGMPIVDADGKLLGYQGSSIDITSRKEAELSLLQKMQELERFNNLTVDREIRMIDLKKEINGLLRAAGQPERYRIVEEEGTSVNNS